MVWPSSLTIASVMEGICWRRPCVCCACERAVHVMVAWVYGLRVGLRGVEASCDLAGLLSGLSMDVLMYLWSAYLRIGDG